MRGPAPAAHLPAVPAGPVPAGHPRGAPALGPWDAGDGVAIAATGAAVPAAVVRSEELEARLGLEPGYILRRTGIRERRVAGPGEATSDLAVAAGAQALAAAGCPPDRVCLLVLATSTPDHLLPPTAPQVAHRLGIRAPAFDLAAACSGWIYALAVAACYLRCAPPGAAALVIGANVLSRRVNWQDPHTAPLFADGAGATVLHRGPGLAALRSLWLDADGSAWDQIYIPAGGSRQPLDAGALAQGLHLMRMARGPALFRDAVHRLAGAARQALAAAGLEAAQVDAFIPHQANGRLVAAAAEALGIPPERTVVNVDRYGNTSAATIPLALHEAACQGRLRPGHRVLLAAVGAGMTAGAAVLEWQGAAPGPPATGEPGTPEEVGRP